jgi:predicted phosphodiesterase
MRIGLLSDVHANLFALRAAVVRLRAEGVDAWVCAGDLVGYGAHPNECVETIAELEPTCVAGNHELMLLDAIPDTRAGWLARRSIGWTRGVVRADVRSYLAALPRTATVAGMAVAHGSPGDPEEYVRTDERAAALLSSLSAEQLLVLGHTHRPWLYGAGVGSVFPAGAAGSPGSADLSLAADARYLVNPGAVGQSRERIPRARVRPGRPHARARPLLRRAV